MRRSVGLAGWLRIAAVAGSVGALAACASDDTDPEVFVERPADVIYLEATQTLENEEFADAATLFDEVERQHPYSPWATRAQLMAAYSHYLDLDYDQAILALNRFIRLHPGNEEVDYAYYLRALSYYEQISDVERDQEMTRRALDALGEVVTLFPDTDYARDARLKRDLTLDQLAGQNMTIGRWYLRQGYYQAAINRFNTVIQDYQTTTHVPEALHRLVEAYVALGLRDQAQAAAAVLGYNYPGSEWYLDSYALLVDEGIRPVEDDAGFVERAMDWLF
ncbi:MAG: outer membrane protein assembly factor BamD [Rhodospirillaceae bacterium]|nr:outer membrane protein assembly factor BamD [Rhodospirillaceae bacterium]